MDSVNLAVRHKSLYHDSVHDYASRAIQFPSESYGHVHRFMIAI